MKTTKKEDSQQIHTVYLGLGNNTGDRRANLAEAIRSLPPQVEISRLSPIYQTPPWGYTDQPDFLNMVVKGTTKLPPEELLIYLKDLEKEIGRTARFHWGPREIDIDILLYDDRIMETPQLTIPHPQMHKRGFVLVPLADLAPELVHPKLNKKIAELKETLDTSEIQPLLPDTPAER